MKHIKLFEQFINKSEELDEAYDGNLKDFRYEFPLHFENATGNNPSAIKKIEKKGKGYEVRTYTYMSEPEMKAVGDEMGLKLVSYQKDTSVAVTVYESVKLYEDFLNESKEEDIAYDILQDLLDERDTSELEMMSIEDAEETVAAYGHKGAKAKKIAKYLQKMAENGGFESVSTKNLEPISEGKREINKVVTAWKKMGVTDLNTIAKLYSDAMTDANFHQETATSKAIGAASKARKSGLKGSDIAAASDWEGSAIAHGTVEYLKGIGEEAASQKLLKTVNGFVSPNGMKTLEL